MSNDRINELPICAKLTREAFAVDVAEDRAARAEAAALIAELVEALDAVCSEYVSHDEGCDLDPNFGSGCCCTCGASETRADAEAALSKARAQ